METDKILNWKKGDFIWIPDTILRRISRYIPNYAIFIRFISTSKKFQTRDVVLELTLLYTMGQKSEKHCKIAANLLKRSPHFDVSKTDHILIKEAINNGNQNLVKILLMSPNFDFKQQNELLKFAVDHITSRKERDEATTLSERRQDESFVSSVYYMLNDKRLDYKKALDTWRLFANKDTIAKEIFLRIYFTHDRLRKADPALYSNTTAQNAIYREAGIKKLNHSQAACNKVLELNTENSGWCIIS